MLVPGPWDECRGEHSLLSGPFWYRNISDFLALVGNFRILVVLLGDFGSTFGDLLTI